jgi:TRAP-type mannitol/chloroaromatic compound transport system permease small subunit
LKPLIAIAEFIDSMNEKFAWIAAVAVLASCLISAGNAAIRYTFDIGSNGWLEIQWYLFAVTVMCGAAYVLKVNEHVRVDLVYNKLKGDGRVFVDLLGLVFFFMPVVMTLGYLCWPIFLRMYVTGEMSSHAGGLIRWPAMFTLPLGFGLLTLQGLSEILKRVAYLTGHYKIDVQYERPLQ